MNKHFDLQYEDLASRGDWRTTPARINKRFLAISGDSHVVEPPEAYSRYIDPKYREMAPRIIKNPNPEIKNELYWAEGITPFAFHTSSAAGLKPHSPSEKFYFSRGPQLVNRVVDSSPYIEQKKAQLAACETMILNMVRSFNESLAARKLQIPTLAAADAGAIREYVNLALIARDRTAGKKYNLEYAEEFHYIGPSTSQEVRDYVQQHARPL